MKQRIITGVLFTLAVAAFIIPAYWTPWPPVILFTFVALVTSRELIIVARQKGLRPSHGLATAGSLFMLLPLAGASYLDRRLPLESVHFINRAAGGFALMAFALLTLMLTSVIIILIRRGPAALPDALATAGIMAYVAFPLSCPIILTFEGRTGFLWLLVGFTSPWISDTFAYFTGMAVGRHPIIPSLSPKKTLEGCIGGMIGSMLVIPLVFYLFGYTVLAPGRLTLLGLLFAMASGLALSLASQLGDWMASGIKRWCGAKDFGRMLPGHGGLMDRFDSAFFTLPIALLLAVLYEVLRI